MTFKSHLEGELGEGRGMMQQQQLRIRKGPYRGDVSALCLISSPQRHLLLAGTGPHVLLYDLINGDLLCSRYVFDGVRVHGICSGPAFWTGEDSSSSQLAFRTSTIVVHGERRVKLFKMLWHLEEEAPQLNFLGSLPRLSYWVMDVRLVQAISKYQEEETSSIRSLGARADDVWLLSVGLSNNSIIIWDLLNSAFIYRVECSERCLLYSMRLWGDSLETLRVAAGTVFNEVLVWKLGSNKSALTYASTFLTEMLSNGISTEHQRGKKHVQDVVINNSPQSGALVKVVDPRQRLSGHEGSIHRLMWSYDGFTLVSVSDDRSARVWSAKREETGGDDPWLADIEAGPVLYGHGSRLWDCYIGEKLLITASEDCTCRVWTLEGKYLATLKGHIGRGIWRCVYDPELNILLTAGADSSIKVQSLDKWVPGAHTCQTGQDIDLSLRRQDLHCNLQSFSISPVWSNAAGDGPSGFLDSKSEYVRCLALTNPWSMYVCTNQGAVYHVNLARSKEASWTLLVDDLEGPIVCMDALVQGVRREGLGGEDDFPSNDTVVVGNGRGKVSVMQVRTTAEQWHCVWRHTWAAEKERQLLGVYFCKSLGERYIFTTDPRGSWRLWHLSDSCILCDGSVKNLSSSMSYSDLCGSIEKEKENCAEDTVDLIAYGSASHARILCVDVCPELQLLVCGDKQGNLTAFSFPKGLLQLKADCNKAPTKTEAPIQLPVFVAFKGAHGISAVASVSLLPFKHGQAEIISTGSDGCICSFHLDGHSRVAMPQTTPHLLCTGIEKIAALAVVESLKYCKGAVSQKVVGRRIAAGFTGSDFLLWDLTHKCEVLRVMCGGWRRPHSVFVGDFPEQQYCFVFSKDQVLQVQRNWVTSPLQNKAFSASDFPHAIQKMTVQSLRSQFHGKEILSVIFLHSSSEAIAHEASSACSWIATGSEDGTVVISRYVEDMGEELYPTSLLGDHVGGSAVRALAVVADVHLVNTGEPLNSDAALREMKEILLANSTAGIREQELLFSAGAKEVLTCWLLDWLPEVEVEEASLDLSRSFGKSSTSVIQETSQETSLHQNRAPLFQWLSTHIPQKVYPSAAKMTSEKKLSMSVVEIDKQEPLQAGQENSNEHNMEQATMVSRRRDDDADGDRRYLALTAFATRCTKTGTLVSFVATASSDATLHLYACHMTHRSWIKLVVLEYTTALVLTVQHFVAPFSSHGQGACDVYMILAGAADGNIAMWDVTKLVFKYSNSGNFDINWAVVGPLRPLTGRGSQGGRLKNSRKQPTTALKLKHGEGKSVEVDEPVNPGPQRFVCLPRCEREMSDEKFEDPAEESGRPNFLRASSILKEHGLSTSSRVDVPEGPAEAKSCLVLNPFEEFTAAHQSGINCMSVVRLQRVENLASNKMAYIVISGGDDQSLHMATFTLQGGSDAGISQRPKVEGTAAQMPTTLQYLSQSSVPCAHSSAVKGVWTDGFWAFSTGLDQRLRCWRINPDSCDVDDPRSSKPLVECLTCVIDIPEPASLDVKDCLGGRYQIVVVGRGLQVINFDSNSLSC